MWYVPGRPETDADSDDDIVDGGNDSDVNGGAAADNVAVPVVSGVVEPAVGSVVSDPSSLVAPAPGVDVACGGWVLRLLRSALVPLWVQSLCVWT